MHRYNQTDSHTVATMETFIMCDMRLKLRFPSCGRRRRRRRDSPSPYPPRARRRLSAADLAAALVAGRRISDVNRGLFNVGTYYVSYTYMCTRIYPRILSTQF